jgi:hypothetical protein
MFTSKMPDITLAQLTAALMWVGAQAVSAGWIDNNHMQKYVALGSTILTATWIVGDAVLRGARNVRHAIEASNGVVRTDT